MMADTVDRATRSRIMAQVRSSNTKPEVALRKALFSRGLRYRLHVRGLPGRPDLVFVKYNTVIFVNGCFWHWHGCARCRMPLTNVEYWGGKIAKNITRDRAHIAALRELGWRVLIVWECALKARTLNAAADEAANWIRCNFEPVRTIEPLT